MIDTDKYEGHTPAYGWRKADGSAMHIQSANNNADAELMADAPLLLAEVKRLRGIIDYIRDTGRMERRYGRLLSIMEKVLTTEEYLEWRRLND